MVDKKKISPDEIVMDLVLNWSEVLGQAGTAKVLPGGGQPVLAIACRNHQGAYVSTMFPIVFNGEPFDGDSEKGLPPRFILFRLGPTVWKVTPSIVIKGSLHAFLTITGVPEPAPWHPA